MRSPHQSSPDWLFEGVGTVHARQEMINDEMECSWDVHNENVTTAMFRCINGNAGFNGDAGIHCNACSIVDNVCDINANDETYGICVDGIGKPVTLKY